MKKRVLAISLVVAMLAVAVIGGSLAYFTDTDEAVNTFTVGNVDIELSEPSWVPGNDGTALIMPGKNIPKDPTIAVADDSQPAWVFLDVKMNKYVSLINLIGVDAYKNSIDGLRGFYPGFANFVTLLAENNDLRADVLGRWFKGIDHAKWKVMNLDEITAQLATPGTPNAMTIVLGYQTAPMEAGDDVTFMTAFEMPETVTLSMLDGEDAYRVGDDDHSASNFNTDKADFKMTFTARAIQAEGITDIDAAYTALYK